jgi:hypothetical protein
MRSDNVRHTRVKTSLSYYCSADGTVLDASGTIAPYIM